MSADVAALLARLPPGSVRTASSVAPVVNVLPGPVALRDLLPRGGLKRGSTVEVALGDPLGTAGNVADRVERVGSGGWSLTLALLASVSQAGSWCALVGAPGVGLAAAQEAGVDLARLALVPHPGQCWPKVAGALLDGFDLVAVVPPSRANPADLRALSARARKHETVLLGLGAWPGADLRLVPVAGAWEGLSDGHGRLRNRRLTVRVSGRGAGAQTADLPATGT